MGKPKPNRKKQEIYEKRNGNIAALALKYFLFK